MGAPSKLPQYTIGEYLELEAYSNVKHEYLDGHIYAMAGGTPEHGAMAVRIGASLLAQLTGRRRNVYSSDVRVRVKATGLDTYPDLSVVCEQERRDDDDPHALVNPVVLVEVTSPSSEAYDRGEKLAHYKQIPSLREVVIVSHGRPHIEVWSRGAGGGWSRREAASGGSLALASIDCRLDVDEVYRNPLSDDD